MNELEKKLLSHVLSLVQKMELPQPCPGGLTHLTDDQVQAWKDKCNGDYMKDINIRSDVESWLSALIQNS